MSEANDRLDNAREDWSVFLTCVGSDYEVDTPALLLGFSVEDAHELDFGFFHALYGGGGVMREAARVVQRYGSRMECAYMLSVYDTLLGVDNEHIGILSLATSLFVNGPDLQSGGARNLRGGLTRVVNIVERYGSDQHLMAGLALFTERESELGPVMTLEEMQERYDRVERSVLTLERAI
jgi:hypothetical protein